MKLIIKNLGSIKNNNQAIDLSKDFLVFVGHNNSGKTYVSQLLWAIYNDDILKKFALEYSEKLDLDVQSETIEMTKTLIDEILKQYTIFLQNEILKTLNVQKQLDNFPNISLQFDYELSELKKQNLQVVAFNRITIPEKALIPVKIIIKNEDSLKLLTKFKELENAEEMDNFFHLLNGKDLQGIGILSFLMTETFLKTETIPKRPFGENISNNLKSELLRVIIKLLLQDKNISTFFLPSSRHFYPIFYRYFYKIEREDYDRFITKYLELLESQRNQKNLISSEFISQRKALKALRKPYTEPINQLFEKLYSLNDPEYKYDNYDETYLSILQKLQKIMGGEINIGSVEGIAPIEFYLKLGDNKTNLPMHLASSSVGQLTLLYLYFKYWVEENRNFLIIDEPEENLHPENQIKLLEILIDFATQNNNKVLITTHSPLLADAVNNYIYLDVLKNDLNLDVEKIIEENNLQYLNPSVSLSKDKIGVYFFTGDKIIDYQADDYGVSFSNFREVQNNVDKSARILTDYIYSGGDETEDE